MRLGRLDSQGPKTCMAWEQYAIDLSVVEGKDTAPPLALLADADMVRGLNLLARGSPPQSARRRQDNVQWLSPVESKRIVLHGGAQGDRPIEQLQGAGGSLPAGLWHTGVALVVARDVKGPKAAMRHAAGYAVFHAVGGDVVLGPWLADMAEIGEPNQLMFSAFHDDLPVIRPVKALLDWEGALQAAHEATPLKAGDLVALCAPPREASGDVRAAMVKDGQVLMRCEATLGQPS